jgi:hypothetical protein
LRLRWTISIVLRMAARTPKTRTLRRARGRMQEKLVRDLERLARLEPGGAADRPIDVASPAQVDVMAEARPCPLCQGSLRLIEHAAATVDGVRLRVAHLACTACGVRRHVYFRLSAPPLH